MGSKLGKGEYPSGHSADDFECFGPPATKDGQFEGTKIADLGCFTQDGKDSNKFYHGSVVKSKKNNKWYAYFEWGRTGSKNPDCQFVECDGEDDAQDEYCSQLHSKNDKRGEWATIAGIKTLRAKAGKDCYLVRAQATRATGLPSAKTIKMNDGAKPNAAVKATAADPKKSAQKSSIDSHTMSLMRDLNVATVQYTKGAMADASIPMQASIDEGRQILDAAMARVAQIGHDEKAQVNDTKMKDLTNVLYSRIPKVKPVGAAVSTWVLSQNNILGWRADLDAFESALYTVDIEHPAEDPLSGMGVEMSWIDPASSLGEWVKRWAAGATRRRHHYGAMRVINIWTVKKPNTDKAFRAKQEELAKIRIRPKETALHQTKRPDIVAQELYEDSHTAFLFHGTRSVNVSGILRKSLLMPKQLVGVAITGALFGPGLYFADDWMKSAGYTSLSNSYWSRGDGGVKGRKAFMFLADVALGHPYVADGEAGYTKAPKGHHSVFGKGGHSSLGSSTLQNNEWIVYETEQHNLRYLIEFEV